MTHDIPSCKYSAANPPKWQPVMVIVNGRLECDCGALAIFVTAHMHERSDQLYEVQYWCQSCFDTAQKGEFVE